MEEHVGQVWHKLISGLARQDHPEAAVRLEDVRKEAGIVFRALGGDGGLKVEACTETAHAGRRTLAQRLAGTGSHVELAWRDMETLRLPMQISCFNTEDLNRDLYLWLTALAAESGRTKGHWVQRNSTDSAKVLASYPGLRARYKRLLIAHMHQRPDPKTLRTAEAAQESVIQAALNHPGEVHGSMPVAKRSPMPVPLWLNPSPPVVSTVAARSRQNDQDESSSENDEVKAVDSNKRRRGERVATPDGRDGLLAFRLESMFSRAEYVAVDRSTEEDEDADAQDAMEDLSLLSMASGGKRPKSRLRFDLDLPSEEQDDLPLGEGILLPEWDYRKACLVPDHCKLQPLLAKDARPQALPAPLRAKAKRMRHLFEMIQAKPVWTRAEPDGSEIDIEAYISKASLRKRGEDNGELRVFRQLRSSQRDLSCLLLADLSLSTDTWVDNDQRIIDVIRDSLLLFAEALSATNDPFALYGFSSVRRHHVRFHTLKTFNEKHSELVIGRIQKIKPGYYTRMGAAIRQASRLLGESANSRKLLILLTDGKPNDLDVYEGRYGVEDTRQAVIEASVKGITPFCVTVDEKAESYLPYIFGQSAYIQVKNLGELPERLPRLYANLVKGNY